MNLNGRGEWAHVKAYLQHVLIHHSLNSRIIAEHTGGRWLIPQGEINQVVLVSRSMTAACSYISPLLSLCSSYEDFTCTFIFLWCSFVHVSLVPRVFHALAGLWGMPSFLTDRTQPKTRYTWPESYGTLVSEFVRMAKSMCPVKHVHPLTSHRWALSRLAGPNVCVARRAQHMILTSLEQHTW